MEIVVSWICGLYDRNKKSLWNLGNGNDLESDHYEDKKKKESEHIEMVCMEMSFKNGS
jgi:hypothetical protein